MRRFGFIRLHRDDLSAFHKAYFRIFGVCSDHKLRFLYARRFMRRYIDRADPGAILDAGCGMGDYAFYLAERYPQSGVLAVDILQDRIDDNTRLLAKARLTNLRFERQDLACLNHQEDFDFINCIDVLEHLENQPAALAGLRRALKPDGRLFIHIPLKRAKPVIFDRRLRGFHQWVEHEHLAAPHTRESFLRLAGECGFDVIVSANTFNHYLGEFAVSIIMLFFRNSVFDRVMLALLTPLLCLLIYLDIAVERKQGNGLAVLLARRPESQLPA